MMSSFDVADMILPYLPKGGCGWILKVSELNTFDKAQKVCFQRVRTQNLHTLSPDMSESRLEQKWNA